MRQLFDDEAERTVLGAMVRDPIARGDLLAELTDEDFGQPWTGTMFRAIEWLHDNGELVTAERVLEVAADVLLAPLPLARVRSCVDARGKPHAQLPRLVDMTERRFVAGLAGELSAAAYDTGSSPVDAVELAANAASLRRAKMLAQGLDCDPVEILRLGEVLPDPDWVIPDVIERLTRTVLVGPSGYGKSYMLRQIAMCVAAGLHPFRERQSITAKRVLMIELENGRQTVMRRLQEIRQAIDPHLRLKAIVPDWDRLRVLPLQRTIDLGARNDLRKLHSEMQRFHPDLLIIGPIYRMYTAYPKGDIGGEGAAVNLQGRIDDLIGYFNCSVIIEGHTPKDSLLTVRGSSAWSNWPDYGWAMIPVGHQHAYIEEVRGPRGDGRWPQAMSRDDASKLPWFADVRRDPKSMGDTQRHDQWLDGERGLA